MTVRNPLVLIPGGNPQIQELPAGDTLGGAAAGPKGATGDAGTAATIAVGTVTTGAAGSSATVTNSGTSSAAVFDFTIPRGDTGSAGSAWTSVESHTASSSATLDFTTGITGSHSQYQLVLDGFVPATNTVDLYLLFSTDGGSTYLSTNYKWTVHRISSDTGNVASVGSGVAQCQLANTNSAAAWSNGAGQSLSATLSLYNLNSASLMKYYAGHVVFIYTTGLLMTMQVGGSNTTTTAVNALRLKASSGNIASGIATLYGR